MMITTLDLAARAESFVERLARASVVPTADLLPEASVSVALGPWARAYARGDLEALLRRLEWDGFDPRVAATVLAGEGPPAAELESNREWSERVSRVAERAALDSPGGLGSLTHSVPFGELLVPWVEVATDELGVRLGAGAPTPVETWLESAQGLLFGELSRLAAPALYPDYLERRGADPSPGCYRRYVASMQSDLYGRLCDPLPGLARRLAEISGDWVAAISEVVARYERDRPAIGELLEGGVDPGPITELSGGLSDRHRGRQVLRVRLSGGGSVAYKPRDLGMEAAWSDLLDWLRKEGLALAPRSPRCLRREGYGWQEWLSSEPLSDREGARSYYRRAGCLLALATLLGARDLHAENLVATQGAPAVVDAEMILQPLWRAHTSTAAECREPALQMSVLDSGLLATPVALGGGRSLDRAGLRAPARRLVRTAAPIWEGLGTDLLAMELGEKWAGPDANAPRLDGAPIGPEAFLPEVVQGFTEAYRFVLEKRRELCVPGGPLSAFGPAKVRVLLRPSQEYARLLLELAKPRFLSNPLASGMALEAFVSSFHVETERPALWGLVAEERAALLAGDIPHFAVAAGADEMRSADGLEVAVRFERSALDHALARLSAASEERLEREVELLGEVLSPVRRSRLARRGEAAAADVPGEAGGRRYLELAAVLGEQLVDGAARQGSVLREGGLGAGPLGVALFLAALGRRLDEGRFSVAAERLLVDSIPSSGERRERLGGFSGVGGELYALAWLDRWLPERSWLDRARFLLTSFDEGRVAADCRLDLEGGAAGAILGLLALSGTRLGDESLSAARLCGEHLLRCQEPCGSGGAAWRGEGGLALAGCAHGAAGIARALAALAEATGDSRFAVAAAAAIAFERGLFDAQRGNWPVRARRTGAALDSERLVWMTSWCHGAPGGALCRLLLPERFQDEPLRHEIRSALDSTASAPEGSLDYLCCGNLGRASVLLAAAERTGDGERLAAALRITESAIARAAAPGADFGFALDPAEQLRPPTGFLRGVAGIGYHLLRMADPYGLPDVLALEAPSEVVGATEEPMS